MAKIEKATLAGGCFWGVEELFRQLKGVQKTTVGYTGGDTPSPTYETVKTSKTGHAEAIEIEFDPQQITYDELLNFFFKIHDPTTLDRQGNDRGSQYRSEIFFHSPEQREIALRVIQEFEKKQFWPAPIVTKVNPARAFFSAEEYHQDYLQKNPGGYTCHWLRPG